MLQAFATPRNRRRTLILLVACGALATAAAVIGIDDNLPGILVAYLAVVVLILAFVHPARTEAPYRLLVWGSLAGGMVAAFLHEGFEALAHGPLHSGVLHALSGGLAGGFFLLAVLVAPPAFVVGCVGALVMAVHKRRHPTPTTPTAA
jgi:hypothetical protein